MCSVELRTAETLVVDGHKAGHSAGNPACYNTCNMPIQVSYLSILS